MSWFRRVKDRVNDEIDDVVDDDKFDGLTETDNFLKRIFGDLSKSSVGIQLAVGATAGGLSGFLFQRLGLLAALLVGGGLILIQVAHHQQWITVNWGNVDRRADRFRRQIRRSNRGWQKIGSTIELFVRENVFIAAAFAGGFFIGLTAQ